MAAAISAVLVVAPRPASLTGEGRQRRALAWGGGGGGRKPVECSSRPKKKGTAHHMKTRPKKTQPWDVKRKGPTLYPSPPPLPPDWTFDAAADDVAAAAQQEEAAAAEASLVVAAATVAP